MSAETTFNHNIANKTKEYYKYWGMRYRQDTQDLTRMEFNSQLASGNLDRKLLEYVWNPHKMDTVSSGFPVEFRHKDIISATLKRVQGTISTRRFKNKLVAVNKEAINRKRDSLRNEYSQYVIDEVMAEIQKAVIKDNPKATPEQLTSLVEKNTPERIKKLHERKHVDPAEIIGNHVLNYVKRQEDCDIKFMQAAWDAITYGIFVTYDGIQNNKAVLRHVNAKNFTYVRSTNSPFIKDFDAGTVHYWLTPTKILEYWGDFIKPNILKELFDTQSLGGYSEFGFGSSEYSILNYIGDSFFQTDNNKRLHVTHSVWKAATTKGILTFIDKDGILRKDLVDPGYELNPALGDVSLEWKSLPELHEVIMLGKDTIIKSGVVEGQLFDIDNMYNKDLPFKGVVLNDHDGQPKGLVDYQANYALLYDIILYRIEDFMRQDKGNLLMMNMDIMNLDPDKFFHFAEKNNIGFYSFKDVKDAIGNRDINTLVKDIDRSLAAKIDQYINLAEYIETKSKTIIGINPQFEGDIQEREGQRNVERAVGATSLALEPMFVLIETAKNQIMQSLVYNQIAAFIKNKTTNFTYLLDDVGIMAVELDPIMLMQSKYYLFMENNAKQEKILDVLTQLAVQQSASSQLEVSAIGRFLQEEDLNSALELLQLSEMEKHEKNMELEQTRNANATELENSRQEFELIKIDKASESRLHEIDKKGEWDLLKAAVVGSGFAEDKDINDNQVPDIVEIANSLLEQQKFQHQKMQDYVNNKLASRKLDIEEKKVAAAKNKKS